ncbi:ABC transporter ATP-binding protein [Macrococcus hajekii]|uniref:ABC transporter ATP-binding protein n=1 Tax=Macrococcus hajekii TaxID=198482 RepID=A0A4V3BE49_9STAP|nr:ABC transporter ATP-binding protein [Macrococcus hajekii]TDM02114.1 ABC transporter ATP-binding protein [Macrococcus hajekii]GGB08741.1 ABC transporter ATP-binding protein [Macrococcus hajekii]
MHSDSIRVTNLRLKYPGGQNKIFDQLDIEIKDKEKVLLLGPSGCGKSTLLNVLAGIVPDLIELPMKYDELQIDTDAAVIFQDPDSQFCMPKVYEELAFILENQQVPRNEMKPQIERVLRLVGLEIDEDQTINQLSGGMKQKLAIAGTLLQNAHTLFLDEPSAMLDTEATEHLWELLIQLWHDQTVVIVEHKVEHIWQHVDRVIVMNERGEIIQQGNPVYILEHYENLLSEYGVWHPRAWQHAPEPLQYTSQSSPLFKCEQGAVIRGNRKLYEVGCLEVGLGEWIVVTGNNGTGKTTLLESMLQMVPYKGTMTYNDQKLRKVKDAARYFYLVYQNPELQFIQNSVYDEIYINYFHQDKTTAIEKTEHMLQLLQLRHVSKQHPFELSMGQKRRLSVATALSSPADMILLDEPTFGLDSQNTFQLLELFKARVRQGQTLVMVTHDSHIVERYPSRRLHVESGRLTEVGVHHV